MPLAQPLQITSVKVTNRGDCCAERLNGFDLAINGVTCASNNQVGQGVTAEVSCAASAPAGDLTVRATPVHSAKPFPHLHPSTLPRRASYASNVFRAGHNLAVDRHGADDLRGGDLGRRDLATAAPPAPAADTSPHRLLLWVVHHDRRVRVHIKLQLGLLRHLRQPEWHLRERRALHHHFHAAGSDDRVRLRHREWLRQADDIGWHAVPGKQRPGWRRDHLAHLVLRRIGRERGLHPLRAAAVAAAALATAVAVAVAAAAAATAIATAAFTDPATAAASPAAAAAPSLVAASSLVSATAIATAASTSPATAAAAPATAAAAAAPSLVAATSLVAAAAPPAPAAGTATAAPPDPVSEYLRRPPLVCCRRLLR